MIKKVLMKSIFSPNNRSWLFLTVIYSFKFRLLFGKPFTIGTNYTNRKNFVKLISSNLTLQLVNYECLCFYKYVSRTSLFPYSFRRLSVHFLGFFILESLIC